MKATGIIRQVDELGRVVLPIELRRKLNINIKDAMEIFTEGDTIVLKKYEIGCLFCGDTVDLKELNGKYVCKSCLEKLNK